MFQTVAKYETFATVFLCLFAFLSVGCAGRADWRADAIAIAAPSGFSQSSVSSPPFELFALVKEQSPVDPVRVYIEGDGRAFVNYQLSTDPTPSKLMLLKLAVADSSPNVAYLARPCQFIRTAACDSRYWSTARYGEEVLKSLQSAIFQISGSRTVELIGYSGGGTVAALLAPRMPQVTGIRTLAANLSVQEQTNHFDLSPLSESLDPIDFTVQSARFPQIHLVAGTDDAVIPAETIRHYQEKLNSPCAQFVYLPEITHDGPWEAAWQTWGRAPLPACGK